MTDARSLAQPGTGVLEAWVPLGLLDFDPATSLPVIEQQGLTPVRLTWHQGRLREPTPLSADQSPPSRMVLPRLVDCHVHLDKAYTWQDHPNLSGSYGGALDANLQEHNSRTVASVLQRGERAMARAFDNGLRALRSHVDSGGPGTEPSWDALLTLQQRWRSRIDLQLVALVPLAFWGSSEADDLARRVAASGGCLGGVLTPPCGYDPGRLPGRFTERVIPALGVVAAIQGPSLSPAPAADQRPLVCVHFNNKVGAVINQRLIYTHGLLCGLNLLARQQRFHVLFDGELHQVDNCANILLCRQPVTKCHGVSLRHFTA